MNNPFKAYDVRGVFNKEFNINDVVRIAQTHATYLKQQIVIGGDGRTTTDAIKKAYIAGYISSGFDVIDLGRLPTPIINFYGYNHKIDSVVITGSHTPPNYNGIKFFDKLGIVYNDKLSELEKRYKECAYSHAEWDEVGRISYDNNAVNEYLNNLKAKIDIKNKIKIVIDHGNGVTGLCAGRILSELGCEVIEISKDVDGLFPNRSPEPAANNLSFLKKRVVEVGADFGCAFDGDGDRSVFVDNKGRVLDGSVMTSLFAKEIVKKNPESFIVASVDMSSMLKEIVDEHGGNLVWCPVGMKNLSFGLIENKAMFGGEVSSHFYFNDFYPFSDGILACAKLAELLSNNNVALSELVDSLPARHISHYKFSVKDNNEKFVLFDKIKKEFSHKYELDLTDGIKFFLNSTDWVLIRPSNTEPLIRLTIESKTKEDLNKAYCQVEPIIKKFI